MTSDVDRWIRARKPAVAGSTRPSASSEHRHQWVKRGVAIMVGFDLMLILVAVATGLFEDGAGRLGAMGPATPCIWIALLAAGRAYDTARLGTADEFRAVVQSSAQLTAIVAVLALIVDTPLPRGLILLTIPFGSALLLLRRVLSRAGLRFLRSRGRCLQRVLAVGSSEDVLHLVNQANRAPEAGLQVVAACVPPGGAASRLPVPALGTPPEAAVLARRFGYDTVAVTTGDLLGRSGLRQLAWDLEGTCTSLLLAPALTDVAGPRVRVRPLGGVPLLSLEVPAFTGGTRVIKGVVDHLAAVVAISLLWPIMLVIAALIKIDSRGPVFYRQVRAGRGSRTFVCWKFRTMAADADEQADQLLDRNDCDGLLFKMRRDPRITRIGRFLRRSSIDELPQLFNVLVGDMSLVGPRPPLPREVDLYEEPVRRRLLVKPGLTGLWQVSGRSDLSWEEAVRLDLYYVENWSPMLDLVILARTVVAVLRGRGAY